MLLPPIPDGRNINVYPTFCLQLLDLFFVTENIPLGHRTDGANASSLNKFRILAFQQHVIENKQLKVVLPLGTTHHPSPIW